MIKGQNTCLSWDSHEHQQHILSFAGFLRDNGFEADLDMTLSHEETSINFVKMMHSAFSNYSKIIVVLSNGYKRKAESFSGGVGEEYQILIGDIKNKPKKYILVSFNGRSEDIVPVGLAGRNIVDLSVEDGKDMVFRKLMDIPAFAFPQVSKKRPYLETIIAKPFSVKQLVSHPVKTTIEESSVLQAVIKSLKTYPIVKNGDVVVLGKVNSFISGYHLSGLELKKELSEYIELGCFSIINERISITDFGIEELKLNP